MTPFLVDMTCCGPEWGLWLAAWIGEAGPHSATDGSASPEDPRCSRGLRMDPPAGEADGEAA